MLMLRKSFAGIKIGDKNSTFGQISISNKIRESKKVPLRSKFIFGTSGLDQGTINGSRDILSPSAVIFLPKIDTSLCLELT